MGVAACRLCVGPSPAGDAHGVRSMIDGPVTWAREGTVVEVLTAIALVPQPGRPGAPLTAIDMGLPVAQDAEVPQSR